MKESKDLKNFWIKCANKYLIWKKKPSNLYIENNNYYEWFSDGKINLYENCIIRHLKKYSNKKAIITLDKNKKIKSYTYNQIHHLTLSFEKKFLNSKVKKNIMIHASSSIESAIAMLACIKKGYHFCVVFEDLEKFSIYKRIKIFKPDVIFTSQPSLFKKKIKIIDFKKFKFIPKNYSINTKINYFNSGNSLFTLFTSGSTGEPKGVVHSTGGYGLYTALTCHQQFGITKNSIVLTASDAGWINGHTYSLIGPLMLGATTILIYKPIYLLNYKILQNILKLKITILYLPVTLIRMMRQFYKNKIFKSKNLKTLGSMGEPLAREVGNWFAKTFNLNNKSIINTYYQTETGGIICSPSYRDNVKKFLHGSVGAPVNKFIKIENLGSRKKEFKILSPWPGCMKKLLNGDNEYQKYWDKSGFFRMFDLATKIKKQITIHGRLDDVINIRGHRIGSEEVETILLKIKNIVEVAAIAVDDELEGKCIYIFLKANKNVNDIIEKELLSNFGSFALPRRIIYLSELPKTRSGKILRRVLKIISQNPNKKFNIDLSTILKRSVINEVIKKLKK